jgi:nucleotide-binding universal stress UspA family protein
MFDTVIIATDGSESASRAVEAAVDLAKRFDATVHALFVIDERELEATPAKLRDELADALEATADDALAGVETRTDRPVTTAVRQGQPRREIIRYADEVSADLVAAGTRGRHGDHGFLLGSVAEGLVRNCDRPVLTVRQLAEDERAAAV